MDRAGEFIRLHNEISAHLRRMMKVDSAIPFTQLVDLAGKQDATVRRAADRLKDYADLRNAIVHHRSFPKEVIAEPTQATLERFSAVVDRILNPVQLIPAFRKELQIFSTEQPLIQALTYMRKNDFSQVIVRRNGKLGLLTAEGIAKLLEEKATDDIISIQESTVGDSLLLELQDSFVLMRRTQTVDEAREAFAMSIENGRPRLFAVLITETGKDTEEPLGIVTPWDLLERDGD